MSDVSPYYFQGSAKNIYNDWYNEVIAYITIKFPCGQKMYACNYFFSPLFGVCHKVGKSLVRFIVLYIFYIYFIAPLFIHRGNKEGFLNLYIWFLQKKEIKVLFWLTFTFFYVWKELLWACGAPFGIWGGYTRIK